MPFFGLPQGDFKTRRIAYSELLQYLPDSNMHVLSPKMISFKIALALPLNAVQYENETIFWAEYFRAYLINEKNIFCHMHLFKARA